MSMRTGATCENINAGRPKVVTLKDVKTELNFNMVCTESRGQVLGARPQRWQLATDWSETQGHGRLRPETWQPGPRQPQTRRQRPERPPTSWRAFNRADAYLHP